MLNIYFHYSRSTVINEKSQLVKQLEHKADGLCLKRNWSMLHFFFLKCQKLKALCQWIMCIQSRTPYDLLINVLFFVFFYIEISRRLSLYYFAHLLLLLHRLCWFVYRSQPKFRTSHAGIQTLKISCPRQNWAIRKENSSTKVGDIDRISDAILFLVHPLVIFEVNFENHLIVNQDKTMALFIL